MQIKKGKLLIEGKTKRIFAVDANENLVIVEAKNAITAFDDPTFTKEFNTKAKYSNITTSRIFELLKKNNIPIAFIEQFNDTAFVSPKCTMIPLEVIARRYAVGSYLKRHPEFSISKIYKKIDTILDYIGLSSHFAKPYRFKTPLVEFFLKTTRGELILNKETLLSGLDPKKGEEDPFIRTPYEKIWKLVHPKKIEEAADLNKNIEASKVIPTGITMQQIADITLQTFLAIEELWQIHDFKLIDFKIELGVDTEGKLMVADVIDNDSWRLRDKNWNDISKQSFRDGESLSRIEDNYALVAHILSKEKGHV